MSAVPAHTNYLARSGEHGCVWCLADTHILNNYIVNAKRITPLPGLALAPSYRYFTTPPLHDRFQTYLPNTPEAALLCIRSLTYLRIHTDWHTHKSTYYTSIRALIPCEQTAPEISVSSASCPTVIHQMLWAQNACLILSLRATAVAVVVLPTPPMPLGPNRPRLPSLSNDERQSK